MDGVLTPWQRDEKSRPDDYISRISEPGLLWEPGTDYCFSWPQTTARYCWETVIKDYATEDIHRSQGRLSQHYAQKVNIHHNMEVYNLGLPSDKTSRYERTVRSQHWEAPLWKMLTHHPHNNSIDYIPVPVCGLILTIILRQSRSHMYTGVSRCVYKSWERANERATSPTATVSPSPWELFLIDAK